MDEADAGTRLRHRPGESLADWAIGVRPTGVAWERRHHRIVLILLAHVPLLVLFGVFRRFAPAHVAVDVLPVLLLAGTAMLHRLSPRLRSVASAVGLMTAASALVHLAGGKTEAHFLYFVLLGVLALYDDWVPYAAAVVFVLVEHSVMGVVAPQAIWGASAQQSPWTWASIHGAFLLAASLIAFVSWRWRDVERSAIDEERRLSEEHFRLTFEAAPIGVAIVAIDGRLLRVNPALCAIVGYPAEVLVGATFQALSPSDDLAHDVAQLDRCLEGSIDSYEMVKCYTHSEGRQVWVEVQVAVARDVKARPSHYVAQIVDITERRSAAATLAESKARFTALVEHSSDLISIADPDGRLIYASPAYRNVLGIDPAERLGQPMAEFVHPEDRPAVAEAGLLLASTPGGTTRVEFRYANADSSWRWVEAMMTNRLDDPAVGGYVVNTRDVTDRVEAVAHLAHRATHDALTGLPNRALLQDRMAQAQAAAARGEEQLAALFIDLDHFKEVNDTYGHGVGDLLLVDVARRLAAASRAQDTVARQGGDEFVVLARVRSAAEANQLAARLCASFEEPFLLGDLVLAVTASVGVATASDVAEDLDLMGAADIALYATKDRGRAGWTAYTSGMAKEDRREDLVSVEPAGAVEKRRAEDRYRAYVAGAGVAIVVHVDGVVVAVSPPVVAMFDAASDAQLVGRRLAVFGLGDLTTAVIVGEPAVDVGGWTHPHFVEVTTDTGRTTRLEVTSTPTSWAGAIADQLTLRPAEDRWNEIVRIGAELTGSVTQAVIITDLDYRIVAWNDPASQLYGWSADEVLGSSLADVVPWAGTDRERAEARLDLEARGRWTGRAYQSARDGRRLAVDAVTQVIHDHRATPIGIVSVNVPAIGALDEAAADATLVDELETAIAQGQLLLAYQPIFGSGGDVAKVEALVRWDHPARGLLMPGEFIPAAEASQLVVALTGDVLRRSCAQVAAWRHEGMADLELTVNVSGGELADPGLVDRVVAALDASGLPATALWLEITETALAIDVDRTTDTLARLCGLGVRIALDDFGTGFATLAQLHRFPAHALKIDRLFVDGLGAPDGGDTAIVRAILALADELGLAVIAEGVETEAQRDQLVRMGCGFLQGYLLARPAFAEPAPPWLASVVPPRSSACPAVVTGTAGRRPWGSIR